MQLPEGGGKKIYSCNEGTGESGGSGGITNCVTVLGSSRPFAVTQGWGGRTVGRTWTVSRLDGIALWHRPLVLLVLGGALGQCHLLIAF